MFRSTGSRVVALLAVTVLAGGGVAAVSLDGSPSGLPFVAPSEAPTPSPDPTRSPLLLPASDDAPTPTGPALTRALAPVLADPAIAGRLAVSVVDVESGASLLAVRATASVLPASTAKIATAVAALTALEPTARLVTRVVAGATPGEVVLVGGGDPLLAGPSTKQGYPKAARLVDLAAGLTGVTRVLVDDSLYSGPRLGPGWRPAYVTSGDVAPVSSLYVDSGRSRPGRGPRVADPALAAGQALARLLGVTAPVARVVAGADAAVLSSVSSAPVEQLVEDMLLRSDNDLAESLARQVALVKGQPATFAGAAAAVRLVLEEAGVPRGSVALVDGSGLSRDDRLQPAALTAVLRAIAAGEQPRLTPALAGLPVAGFDGTLAKRFRRGPSLPAAGSVRAKTGTLNGVSALAGLVRTRDGRLLAFDLTADGVPIGATRQAEAALDRFAAALASCGCP